MDPILWRRSFGEDVVVTALPVAEEELDAAARPVILRAAAEGMAVA